MAGEKKEFLPLGSIVLLNGSVKKLMILARGAIANMKGEQRFFDYGACTYPEGVIGDTMLYFNGKDIVKVISRGYSDEEEDLMQENLMRNVELLKNRLAEQPAEAK
ncbi:MAG: DUF4176 domain-containing protein [Lachnospiraceae bacterium]|nr:DUF4176 domain-containing protein [Lachnospiraceae bacterium]